MTSIFGHRKIFSPPKIEPPPPPSPKPAPSEFSPLELNVNFGYPNAEADLDLLGIKYGRITIYWALSEQDPQHLVDIDRQITILERNGITPLIVVHQLPGRLEGADRIQIYTEYANFVANCAVRWPGCNWQIWNEADTPASTKLFAPELSYDPPIQRSYGREYAIQFSIAYDAIKMLDPLAKIVTTGAQIAPAEFLRNCPQADIFAIHVYGTPLDRVAMRQLDELRSFWLGPIWITETGLDVDNQEAQVEAYKQLALVKGFERIFIFTQRNPDLPNYSVIDPVTNNWKETAHLIKNLNSNIN